jgi:hypothetical protein
MCKPSWWDLDVGLSWKNPTANPKDTKETLLQKYEALERHLRSEERFPRELEEESRLWNEGKYKELFLLTTLTSLLGKVTGVHSAVLNAAAKTNELKAEINQSLMKDIRSCLGSTLSAMENLSYTKPKKLLKRPNSDKVLGKENGISAQKAPKMSGSCDQISINRLSCDQQEMQTHEKATNSSASVDAISQLSNKLLTKYKAVHKIQTLGNTPTPSTSHNTVKAGSLSTPLLTKSLAQTQEAQTATPSPPLRINLTQEQLHLLLEGELIPLLNTSTEISNTVPNNVHKTQSQLSCQSVKTGAKISNTVPKNVHKPQSQLSCESYIPKTCHSPMNNDVVPKSSCITSLSEQPEADISFSDPFFPSTSFEPTFQFLETQNQETLCSEFLSCSSESKSDSCTASFESSLPVNADNVLSGPLQPVQQSDETLSHQANQLSPNINDVTTICNVNNSCAATVCDDRAESSHRIPSSDSGQSQSEQSHSEHGHSEDSHKDHGYNSDESAIDFDALFSPEEQSELLEGDGSYILDRFLTDLELS